jgi:peptidoglycan/xylan/chitin deacetylase (PgdA/CDA1 family)
MFIEKYSELQKIKKKTVRQHLRNSALDILAFKDRISMDSKFLKTHRIQFLYVHHLFKDEIENIENLIIQLSKHHQFISYSDAVERILNNKVDDSYIVFSSDDGFKNNLDLVEVLNKYDIKACFFINPNSIGLTNNNEISKWCSNRLNFPPVEFLDWREISEIQNCGHEIGSHTMNHINIASSSKSQIEEEIEKSFHLIKEKCGEVKHFAFPYGRFTDFTSEAQQIVFNVGYKSCASAIRGCHFPEKHLLRKDLMIRRDHIIASWKIEHIIYFLKNNIKQYRYETNLYPQHL